MSGIILASVGNSYEPLAVVGQQEYKTDGTYTWICPSDVTSISLVAVGGGSTSGYNASWKQAGGGGGSLGYKNNLSVTPGSSYTVEVGGSGGGSPGDVLTFAASGGVTKFNNVTYANGGVRNSVDKQPGTGGSLASAADGGGNGGNGGGISSYFDWLGFGGGAGGYSGQGGQGGYYDTGWTIHGWTAGSGGAAAGGFGWGNSYAYGIPGVGIYGEGTSGTNTSTTSVHGSINIGDGKHYGGGGGSKGSGQATSKSHAGGGGAMRIIWPGTDRYFPTTRTLDEGP